MHWYEGSIAEAVNLSKQRNAIFVVFVEGENDLSVEMASTIDDVDVLKRLSDPENFLAIKLKSGSTSYTHFAQIYQFVPVPSLFFIGRNGTPLEVVCAGVQPANLALRIDRILEEHHKEKPTTTVKPSTSGQQIQQQTADLLRAEGSAQPPLAPAKREAEPETSTGAKVQKTEHQEESQAAQEYEVVCDGDVCVRRPRGRPGDPGPSSQPAAQESLALDPTPAPVPAATSAPANAPVPTSAPAASPAGADEKVERARELIEARKREKAAKEKELEKQKEVERRQVGQGVTELKKWQAEQELKQIQEERKREKMENNLARQRILDQIAQDRAERRARDAAPPPPAPPAPAEYPVPHAPPAPTAGDGSARARIQFKLPDGTSHTAHFEATGTLADVQQYVADNLQLSASKFALWTAFPRRELSESDATLRGLQLTPSAALLVLPRRAPPAASPPAAAGSLTALVSFISQLLSTLVVSPAQRLLGWARAWLLPAPPPLAPAPAPAPAAAPAPAPPAQPQHNVTLRRRGNNIHRLGTDRSEEDDNNTWNGNSTQQM